MYLFIYCKFRAKKQIMKKRKCTEIYNNNNLITPIFDILKFENLDNYYIIILYKWENID